MGQEPFFALGGAGAAAKLVASLLGNRRYCLCTHPRNEERGRAISLPLRLSETGCTARFNANAQLASCARARLGGGCKGWRINRQETTLFLTRRINPYFENNQMGAAGLL